MLSKDSNIIACSYLIYKLKPVEVFYPNIGLLLTVYSMQDSVSFSTVIGGRHL